MVVICELHRKNVVAILEGEFESPVSRSPGGYLLAVAGSSDHSHLVNSQVVFNLSFDPQFIWTTVEIRETSENPDFQPLWNFTHVVFATLTRFTKPLFNHLKKRLKTFRGGTELRFYFKMANGSSQSDVGVDGTELSATSPTLGQSEFWITTSRQMPVPRCGRRTFAPPILLFYP